MKDHGHDYAANLAAWQQHTYAEFALGARSVGVLDHPLAAAGVESAAQLLKLR